MKKILFLISSLIVLMILGTYANRSCYLNNKELPATGKYSSPWDTTDLYFFLGNVKDTVILRPVYKINDSLVERLIDSFLCVDGHMAKMLSKSNRFEGCYEINLPDNISVSDDDSLNNLQGVYSFQDKSLLIYNVNDNILKKLYFEDTQDSINLRFNKMEPNIYPSWECLIIHETEHTDAISFSFLRPESCPDLDTVPRFKWFFEGNHERIKPGFATYHYNRTSR